MINNLKDKELSTLDPSHRPEIKQNVV